MVTPTPQTPPIVGEMHPAGIRDFGRDLASWRDQRLIADEMHHGVDQTAPAGLVPMRSAAGLPMLHGSGGMLPLGRRRPRRAGGGPSISQGPLTLGGAGHDPEFDDADGPYNGGSDELAGDAALRTPAAGQTAPSTPPPVAAALPAVPVADRPTVPRRTDALAPAVPDDWSIGFAEPATARSLPVADRPAPYPRSDVYGPAPLPAVPVPTAPALDRTTVRSAPSNPEATDVARQAPGQRVQGSPAAMPSSPAWTAPAEAPRTAPRPAAVVPLSSTRPPIVNDLAAGAGPVGAIGRPVAPGRYRNVGPLVPDAGFATDGFVEPPPTLGGVAALPPLRAVETAVPAPGAPVSGGGPVVPAARPSMIAPEAPQRPHRLAPAMAAAPSRPAEGRPSPGTGNATSELAGAFEADGLLALGIMPALADLDLGGGGSAPAVASAPTAIPDGAPHPSAADRPQGGRSARSTYSTSPTANRVSSTAPTHQDQRTSGRPGATSSSSAPTPTPAPAAASDVVPFADGDITAGAAARAHSTVARSTLSPSIEQGATTSISPATPVATDEAIGSTDAAGSLVSISTTGPAASTGSSPSGSPISSNSPERSDGPAASSPRTATLAETDAAPRSTKRLSSDPSSPSSPLTVGTRPSPAPAPTSLPVSAARTSRPTRSAPTTNPATTKPATTGPATNGAVIQRSTAPVPTTTASPADRAASSLGDLAATAHRAPSLTPASPDPAGGPGAWSSVTTAAPTAAAPTAVSMPSIPPASLPSFGRIATAVDHRTNPPMGSSSADPMPSIVGRRAPVASAPDQPSSHRGSEITAREHARLDRSGIDADHAGATSGLGPSIGAATEFGPAPTTFRAPHAPFPGARPTPSRSVTAGPMRPPTSAPSIQAARGASGSAATTGVQSGHVIQRSAHSVPVAPKPAAARADGPSPAELEGWSKLASAQGINRAEGTRQPTPSAPTGNQQPTPPAPAEPRSSTAAGAPWLEPRESTAEQPPIDIDTQARLLWPRLRAMLLHELRIDRERSGTLRDTFR